MVTSPEPYRFSYFPELLNPANTRVVDLDFLCAALADEEQWYRINAIPLLFIGKRGA